MGEVGRKRVIENFSIQKTVENYEKLYNQLLKRKKIARNGNEKSRRPLSI
jgi:hypothetical protein